VGQPDEAEANVAIRDSYICVFRFAVVADCAGAGCARYRDLFLEQSGMVLMVLVREGLFARSEGGSSRNGTLRLRSA